MNLNLWSDETFHWNNVQLRIPNLPPSRLDNCSIIDIDYQLLVKTFDILGQWNNTWQSGGGSRQSFIWTFFCFFSSLLIRTASSPPTWCSGSRFSSGTSRSTRTRRRSPSSCFKSPAGWTLKLCSEISVSHLSLSVQLFILLMLIISLFTLFILPPRVGSHNIHLSLPCSIEK